MGLLDDAIREHLDLKRRRGADPAEVERAEREALGPVRRAPERVEETDSNHGVGSEGGDSFDHEDEQGWGDALVEDQRPEPESEPERAPRRFLRRSKRAPEPEFPDDEFIGHEPPLSEELPVAPDLSPETSSYPPPAPAEPRPPEVPQGTASRGHAAPSEPFPAAPEPESPTPEPHGADSEPRPAAREPSPSERGHAGDQTVEYDVEGALGAPEEKDGEDVLEETPEFLQDTPDHDRLWFEQRPPRDFDFDG